MAMAVVILVGGVLLGLLIAGDLKKDPCHIRAILVGEPWIFPTLKKHSHWDCYKISYHEGFYSHLNNYNQYFFRKKNCCHVSRGLMLPFASFCLREFRDRGYSDQTCLMHETRISNFMRSNGPSTKIPAEDLRFPSSKKRQKRWNRTFYVLNIRSVDHEIKSQTYWSCHHSFDCLGKKTSRTLAIIIQLPGVSIHPKHVGFFHGNLAPGKEWRISGSLSNGDGVLILDSASSNSTCKAWPIGKVTVGCCQCRLVTNPLETGRSWGSEPTPWPFAKCNHGIQEACLNRSLRLNGVGYHSLDGQTPHVPVRDARHHHARKHTLTYLAWWLMYIIQVSSPNTPSTLDLYSHVALAKLSGSTYVFLTYIW